MVAQDELRPTLSPEVAAVVAPALLVLADVRVRAREPRMDGPMAETAARLRAGDEPAGAIASVRAMYRRLGLDPTKRRPSSEALLRRVRRGEPLPRINAAVDVCNWCSAETQLPFGLYDLDRVEGAITLRLGGPGDGYDGIRKDRVNVAGRLTVADGRGPFGNPTSDSARTMVTLETRRLLFVIYAPRAVAEDRRARALDLTAARARAFLGGVEAYRALDVE